MFPLHNVPTHILPAIFDKMDNEQFMMVPLLNKYTQQVYEASVNRFRQQPLHYLDKMRLPRVSVELPTLKEEYANLILKNLQNGRFPLKFFRVDFGLNGLISTPEVTRDLTIETLAYDSGRDETALFHNAKPWHVSFINRHIFTMKNKKNTLLLVTLTLCSLVIEEAPLDKAQLLKMMWDCVRTGKYPLPDGITVDSF